MSVLARMLALGPPSCLRIIRLCTERHLVLWTFDIGAIQLGFATGRISSVPFLDLHSFNPNPACYYALYHQSQSNQDVAWNFPNNARAPDRPEQLHTGRLEDTGFEKEGAACVGLTLGGVGKDDERWALWEGGSGSRMSWNALEVGEESNGSQISYSMANSNSLGMIGAGRTGEVRNGRVEDGKGMLATP